jgi:hypothetical protein
MIYFEHMYLRLVIAQQEEWFGIDDAVRARVTEQTRNGYKSGLSQIRKWLVATNKV